MDNRSVFFIDSGIGGLPYCLDFKKKNPHERICYLADRENFPYGPMEKNKLSAILASLTEKIIKKTNPKIIILACNTATIAGLSVLRKEFPDVPFVGTVPALKPAVRANRNGKAGVLGTERTIEEINSLYSAEKTPETFNADSCEIIGIAAPELVDFIEQRFHLADENEKKETVKKYIEVFRTAGADTIVLGCTHFLYLIEEFRSEGEPDIKVFDSLDGITKRIEYLLDDNNCLLRAGNASCGECMLLLTGKQGADSVWEKRAASAGFRLGLLDDL